MTGKPDITPLDAVIGANVRRIREQRGISQEDLADIFDVSTPFVSMLETGKRAWKTLYIYKFTSHVGIDPVELMGGIKAEPGDAEILKAIKNQIHHKTKI